MIKRILAYYAFLGRNLLKIMLQKVVYKILLIKKSVSVKYNKCYKDSVLSPPNLNLLAQKEFWIFLDPKLTKKWAPSFVWNSYFYLFFIICSITDVSSRISFSSTKIFLLYFELLVVFLNSKKKVLLIFWHVHTSCICF